MKQAFSPDWKASSQPRKQRKYLHNMSLHTRAKQLSIHLNQSLRERHGIRSIRARKGDKVKVLRGQFKGKEGKIEKISTLYTKVYVTGIELSKKDGSKTPYPLTPSNLLLTELAVEDKKRALKLKASQDKQAETKK